MKKAGHSSGMGLDSSSGALIAIEGIGGSGKSTLAAGVVRWLEDVDIGVVAAALRPDRRVWLRPTGLNPRQ